MKNIILERESITPEKAARFLEKQYKGQRKLNPGTVAQYARDMASGNWNQDIIDPLMLSADGELMNAQHRLSAIIQSGVPIAMYIQRNVPIEAFEYVDNGKSRTVTDFLNTPNNSNVAALAKRAYATVYGKGGLYLTMNGALFISHHRNKNINVRPTRNEIIDYVKDNTEHLTNIVKEGSRVRFHVQTVPLTALSYGVWLIKYLNRDTCLDAFLNDICKLNTETATCASLKKKFFEVKLQKGVSVKTIWFLYTFLNAYEYFRQGGRKVSVTRFDATSKLYEELINEKRKKRRR